MAFYSAMAFQQQLPPAAALAAIACGLLQWGVSLATAAALAALFRHSLWSAAICTTIVLEFGIVLPVVLIANRVPAPWQELALALQLCLPAGWINVAFQYGVLQQRAVAWGMLVPVAILLASLPAILQRIQSQYRLREVRLLDDGRAEAVLDRENRRQPPLRTLRSETTRPAAVSAAPVVSNEPIIGLDPDEARRRVLSREFLKGFDWQTSGWIERKVVSVLDERERMLLEIVFAPPLWTVVAVAVPSSIVVFLVVGLFHARPAPIVPLSVTLILIPAVQALPMVVDCSAGSWTSANGERSPRLIQLPIGYRELRRTVLAAGGTLGIALLPVQAIGGSVLFLGAGHSPLQGALAGLKCGLIFLALLNWILLEFVARWTSRAGVVDCLLFLVFAGAAAVFLIPTLGEIWCTLPLP